MGKTLDKMVKVALIGIAAISLAAGAVNCIEYRQGPYGHKQYRTTLGDLKSDWEKCECENDSDCDYDEECKFCKCIEKDSCNFDSDCGGYKIRNCYYEEKAVCDFSKCTCVPESND